MQETNNILEAFRFMILGMGIVFVFLSIMILTIKLQARIIKKYFSSDIDSHNKETDENQGFDDEHARVAAVIAAISDHRKNIS